MGTDCRVSVPAAHLRGLERMYLGAPVNEYFRPTIELDPGRARITIPVRPSSFHAADALHGSVYFKALDDAAFFAAQTTEPEVFVLTARFEIEFLAPVREGVLEALGEVTEEDRRVRAAATLLVAGAEVARGRGEFARGGPKLADVNSYRVG
jgi:uncharacterized protein (TIGR00369 family)